MHLEAPDEVVKAIHEVVEAARHRSTLQPRREGR
jgi:hypothetical protein